MSLATATTLDEATCLAYQFAGIQTCCNKVVGKAYGIADDPGSVIPYTKVTNDMYWCGRSNSPYYNTLINAAKSGPGDEHLIEYTQAYRYLLDIGYNTACTPGLGSAIFLHCFGPAKPFTGGCVAIPESHMKYVMQHVDDKTAVVINTYEALSGGADWPGSTWPQER